MDYKDGDILAEFNLLDRERMARWSYNELLLGQPQFSVLGLYRNGDRYYIKTKDDINNTKSLDGGSIQDWFKKNKAITCFIEIVNEIDPAAKLISDMSINDIAKCKGNPISIFELGYTLDLYLNKVDCNVKIEEDIIEQTLLIYVSLPLKHKEIERIKKVIYDFEYPMIYKVVYKSDLPRTITYKSEGIELIPTRIFNGKLSKELYSAIQEDDEFWISKRSDILTNADIKIKDIVPQNWNNKSELQGFINASISEYSNIRNYFTLYDSLIFALPISDINDDFYKQIGINENEFLDLYSIGKVKILIPQNVSRYNINLLNKAIDIDKNGILFSRKLAACSLIDTRKRFPFLFPTIGVAERRLILEALYSSFINTNDEKLKKWGMAIINTISKNYLDSNYHLNHKGAMGVSIVGLADLFSETFHAITGKDYFIEMFSASNYVEWAAPFNSMIISPNIRSGYDESQNIEIIAGFYSVIKKMPIGSITKINKIVNGILAVNDDCNIIDFVNSFNSATIKRFRSLVFSMEREYDSVELDSELSEFNKEVRQFEKKKDNLQNIDISGLISGIAGVVGSGVIINNQIIGIPIASLSILIWLEKILYYNRSRSSSLSTIYDYLEKTITKSKSEPVLVSRLNQTISAK